MRNARKSPHNSSKLIRILRRRSIMDIDESFNCKKIGLFWPTCGFTKSRGRGLRVECDRRLWQPADCMYKPVCRALEGRLFPHVQGMVCGRQGGWVADKPAHAMECQCVAAFWAHLASSPNALNGGAAMLAERGLHPLERLASLQAAAQCTRLWIARPSFSMPVRAVSKNSACTFVCFWYFHPHTHASMPSPCVSCNNPATAVTCAEHCMLNTDC